MGRIFVIVGGFLVLLLTAALVVPPFVNWTGYRADFEREASRILGREVHVRGTANARLLPFPSVTFSDVHVGGADDGTKLSIENFSIDAELMPFLRGEVLIFDMQVENPVLQVSLDQQGRIDWKRDEQALLGNAQVKVEKLTLSNGLVQIEDQRNGREYQLQDINAVLSARNISGPWQMNGSLLSNGEKYMLDLSTGEAKPDGTLRVRSRITPEKMAVSFETDGDMTLADGLLNYAGNFNIRTAETASLKSADKNAAETGTKGDRVQNGKSGLLTDLRISGIFNASEQQFAIDEFRMEQGSVDDPYVVNGKAQFVFGDRPHFEINADGQQFQFGGSNTETSGATVPLKEPLAAFRALMGNIPVPPVPGSVDLRLPAIIAGGTTIRTVTISAVPEGQGWDIREFSADFPGRTRVEAKGHLALGDQFGFQGDLLIASRQPSGLAGWLTEEVDESVRQLSGLGISGQVTLNDHIQQIDNLEIGLDGTVLTGSFRREILAGGVPSIDVRLQSKKIGDAALQLMLSPLSKVDDIDALGNQALNVSLKADALALQDIETGALDTVFRFGNGRMDFDRFMLQDLNGATITATGNFEPHENELSGTVDATLLSDDLSGLIAWFEKVAPDQPLVQALYKRSQSYPDLFADSEINFIGSTVVPNGKAQKAEQAADKTTASETSFSVNGKTGRMKLDFSGIAGGQWKSDEGLQIQLNGSAKSEEGEQVLALLGVPVLPLGLVGELGTDITLQGALNIGVRTQIQLKAPDANAEFDGVVTMLPEDMTASGKAKIKAQDLEPFLASTGFTLPNFGLGLPVELASDVQFAKGIMRLPNLQGHVADNKISAKLEASQPENSGILFRGEAETDETDLQLLSEIMLGSGAFTPAKNSWPVQEFIKQPMLPFSFDLKVKSAVADVGQYGVIDDFSAKITKSDNQLNLDEMQGRWKGGQLAGSVQLRNSDGSALFSGDASWKDADLSTFYQLPWADHAASPLRGQSQLSAKLQGSGTTVSALIKSLSGSAQFNVNGFTVENLNADHLGEMIAEADQDETDKNQNATTRFEAIAKGAISGGAFEASDAQFDFTLAGGVARSGLTRLENSKALLESDVQINLADMQLSGNSRFTYKLPDNAVVGGGSPAVHFELSGLYSDPKVITDYQPLVQFLTQRALEREQERVEAMQASLREKQILRREAERLKAQQLARDKALVETEARKKKDAQNLAREKVLHEQRLQEERETLKGASEAGRIGQSVEEFLKTLDTVQ